MNKAIPGPLCILQRSEMGTGPTPLFFSDLCYCEQYLSGDWRQQMKSATYGPGVRAAFNSHPPSQLAVLLQREVCRPTGRTDTACQDALGPGFVLAAGCLMAMGNLWDPHHRGRREEHKTGGELNLCMRWSWARY